MLTVVFTDMEGSTELKNRLGDRAAMAVFERHDALLRQALKVFPEGQEIETAGDSFLLVFATPSTAVKFALQFQSELRGLSREMACPLAVRVGIHVGEVLMQLQPESVSGRDLFGLQIDTCARVMSLAKGNQILMTRAVFDSARQTLKGAGQEAFRDPEGSELVWLNHGPYLLKGMEEPVDICEVNAAAWECAGAPPSSEKAQRYLAPGSELVLGWRPGVGESVPNTRWVLEEKLGEGGFGEVWLGLHQLTKEKRVFKFCFDAQRVRFLKRELTIFRLLKERIGSDPNIVRLHDFFLEEPPYYVEMDYVDGKDLRSWCDAHGGIGALALETRLEIVAQTAEALQAAHDAGIIHRDIKPSNILISFSSDESSRRVNSSRGAASSALQVKLTDFGIGQVVSQEALGEMTRMGFTQTMLSPGGTSQTGTHLYMAPELLAGQAGSVRSDIYSLGVVLYQLLVGDFARPVATDWWKEVADPLLREDLEHCFAGNPSDRFPGAGQLTKNLRALPRRREAMERQKAEVAARERAAYRRGMIRTASLAAVVVVVVIALAVMAFSQARKAQATARRETQERERVRRLLYVANMKLAQQHWEESNIERLRETIEETRDYPYHGFEWYYWQRQIRLELKTFRGHTAPLSAVACSPDGRRMVTGSEDGTAKVWEVASGREVFTLKSHSAPIRSVAFSPNGQWIATGSEDHTTKLWDAASGREVQTLRKHAATIESVSFSPDSQRIVTGSWDQTAKVWDTVKGQEILTLTGHAAPVMAVVFSPDGQSIATGSEDRTAKVWDLVRGRELLTLKGHTGPILAVAVSPNGKRILTGSDDGDARVWDTASGRELLVLRGHTAGIRAVAFSPSGQEIVTGSEDQTAKLWNASTGAELLALKGHTDGIWAAAFFPDGQRIATGSEDQTAKVWTLAHDREVITLKGHTGIIRSVAFSPDGQRAITGSQDKTARLWEVASGRELVALRGHADVVMAVAFAPDGRRIGTGSADQTAKVWKVDSNEPPMTLKGHSAVVRALAFSPDGQRVVTGSMDQTAKVWDATTGREVFTLKGHSDLIMAVAFSPDGQKIVTASEDQTAKIWDARNGCELLTFRGHTAAIWSAAFSPDSQYVVTTGTWDRTGKVWDVRDGHEILTFKGHTDEMRSVAFSPDGQRILTGSWDHTAKVWELASGREVLTLNGHSAGLRSVAFSPDGRRILTGGDDQTAKIWEAASPEQVAAWEREEEAAAKVVKALQRERAAEGERERAVQSRDDGAIKQWLFLAPMKLPGDQSGSQGLDQEQIPAEGQLQPKSDDSVLFGAADLTWRSAHLKEHVIDFNALIGQPTVRSAAYAVCYIHSETEQSGLRMLVGCDDQAKVYLNGKQILRWPFARKFRADQHTIEDIALKPGRNVVVLKVVNEYGGWKGSVRLTDREGNPVKGIKVSATP